MPSKRIHPLKTYRLAHGMTQRDAAKYFGTSQAEWWRLEVGKKRPSIALTKRLVRETGVSLEILMGIAS